jgi:type I restriction-modification system DNA methylase subunit
MNSTDPYTALQYITSASITDDQRGVRINDFAIGLGWVPSYKINTREFISVSSNHLVVEYGMESSAVISFLRPGIEADALSEATIRQVAVVSYNSLVDNHIILDGSRALFINNRLANPVINELAIKRAGIDSLSSKEATASFQKTTDRSRFARCEDALIASVVRAKKALMSVVGADSSSSVSTLLNCIILFRACEDHLAIGGNPIARTLKDTVLGGSAEGKPITQTIQEHWEQFPYQSSLSSIINTDELDVFSNVETWEVENVVRDFYRSELSPCDFNFDILSNHALGKIYEKYVAIFRPVENDGEQGALFPGHKSFEVSSDRAAVYTPQYIANFFCRYVAENVSPKTLRSLTIIDPACGSGIFLRTWFDQVLRLNSVSTQLVSAIALNINGVDKDVNAVSAAKLSLTLLYLNVTGDISRIGTLVDENSLIKDFSSTGYNIVIGNPPFTSTDAMREDERSIVQSFLGQSFSGKPDTYIAFVKLAIDLVTENGFICYVLPHNFLIAENAGELRARFSQEFAIHVVVDLSQIDVFQGVGAYVVLLIAQKKGQFATTDDAIVVRCKAFEGQALHAALMGIEEENEFYQVYKIKQSEFRKEAWLLPTPIESRILGVLSESPKVGSVFNVRQGFVTGADAVFIRKTADIPKDEREIYMSYLPDRLMERYSVPNETGLSVFFPYVDDIVLDAEQLVSRYPETWNHLLRNKEVLENRKSISSMENWWKPARMRSPSTMRRPKIVGPHLFLTPKFCIDDVGRYAVSHSPMVVIPEIDVRDSGDLGVSNEFMKVTPSLDWMKIVLACLNSSLSAWYFSRSTHRYGRGYLRSEVTTVSAFPLPHRMNWSPDVVRRVSNLMEGVDAGSPQYIIEEIDFLVGEIYGFSRDDYRRIFMV